jgi:N utilization substance protein A
VEVPADEVSQAIGKRGVNIKLASRLTGFEIDVYREIPADEEDIDIEQFGDELTEETIEKLKRIGCDTGKAVLELSVDALARRADLERDTAERVLEIIETEFEKGPGIIEAIRQGRFTVESVGAPDGTETDGTSPSEPTGDAQPRDRTGDETEDATTTADEPSQSAPTSGDDDTADESGESADLEEEVDAEAESAVDSEEQEADPAAVADPVEGTDPEEPTSGETGSDPDAAVPTQDPDSAQEESEVKS